MPSLRIRPAGHGKSARAAVKRSRCIGISDQWVIATFPSRRYDIENYPAVKKYLLSFGRERLEQTGKEYLIDGKKIKARKRTNNKWFETQDTISYWDDFSKQKIAWGNLCLKAQYAYIDDAYFVNNPANIIVPGDKYLLAILNSSIADFYIRNLGVTRNGGYFEYKPMFIEQLPIPEVDINQKNDIIRLSDSIISSINNSKNTLHLELKINSIIYNLFKFSPTEIEIIEKYAYN